MRLSLIVMKLQNPNLTLTFGSDLETGHSSIQTITSSWIDRYSIIIDRQLLNGLRSSSDLVKLTIKKGCTSIEDILSTEEDIKAVLKDGNETLFTGYVSTNYSYGVNSWGEKDIQLTIESVGTRLLSAEFIKEGYFLFNGTFENAVRTICTKAGINVSDDASFPTANVHHEVSGGDSCRDLLDQVCYEIGVAYRFDSIGELTLFPIDVTTLSGAVEIGSGSLYQSSQADAITITKKARQYKGAAISYKEHKTKDNVTVFKATNIEMPGGSYFDGTTVHSTDDYEAPYISSVNADSDPDIGSGEIVSITSPTLSVNTTSTVLTHSIDFEGGRYFKLYGHNPYNISQKYTSFSVKANVRYESSTEVIRTNSDGAVYSEGMEWIHDRTFAKRHANLVAQYNRYCGLSYSFFCTTEIDCGSIAHIVETLSGLDVYAMIVASHVQDGSGNIRYTAVGVSVFNLEETTTVTSTTEVTQQPGVSVEDVKDIVSETIPTDQVKWKYLGGFSDAAPTGAENTCWLCTANFGVYLKNYPYYWDGVKWEMWTSITKENSSMIMLMLADADGSTADGVINWFKSIVAQSAIINEIFSREITLMGYDSVIRSQVNDEESGFSITGGGQATFKGAVISGNSSFNGVFNCGVIKTEVLPSSSNTFDAPKQENQAVFVCSELSNNGYVSDEYIRCLVDIIPNAYYLKFVSANNSVRFYDQNYSQISLYSYGYTSNRGFILDSSDPAITYISSSSRSYINAFSLTVYKGGNRLSVDIPSGSAGLLPGMLYEDGGTVKVVK